MPQKATQRGSRNRVKCNAAPQSLSLKESESSASEEHSPTRRGTAFCRISPYFDHMSAICWPYDAICQVCTEGPQLDKISQDEFSLGHTSRPISQQNDSHAERVDGLMDVSVAGRTSRHSPARRHSMRAKDAQLDSHGLTRRWTMISCDELYIMNYELLYDELWWTMYRRVKQQHLTWIDMVWPCEAAIQRMLKTLGILANLCNGNADDVRRGFQGRWKKVLLPCSGALSLRDVWALPSRLAQCLEINMTSRHDTTWNINEMDESNLWRN